MAELREPPRPWRERLVLARAHPDGTNWTATALTVLVLIAGPLLASKIIAERFGFVGPWFNVDFALFCVVMVVGARMGLRPLVWLAYAGIVVSFAMRVMVGIGVIYLVDPVVVKDYLAFASYWPWGLILKWSLLGLFCLGLLYAVVRKIPIWRAKIWPIVLVSAVLIFLDQFGARAGHKSAFGSNIVTSGAKSVVGMAEAFASYKGFTYQVLTTPTMDSIVTAMPAEQRPKRILSIGFEALGRLSDEDLNKQMFAGFLAAAAPAYDVTFAKRAYSGATIAGELRALCGIKALVAPGRKSLPEIAPLCLPARLAAQGYATIGIHGNTGYFYNRREVYPGIGFQHTIFAEDFRRIAPGQHACSDNAFVGVCDATAIGSALTFLGSHDKAFAHVMTLQSHFPLGASTLGTEDCSPWRGVTDPDICLYANTMSTLLTQLAKQVVDAPVRPDVVFIYGDHAPPYAVAAQRAAIEPGIVPVYTLTLRTPAPAR